MNLATLIPIMLKISVALNVFGLGLRTDLSDLTYLVRTPRVFLRSMVSLFVIMPLFAVSLALLFDLSPAVKIALVALAVSPIPPILPKKELKAGGRQEYAISLLVSASVLATILLPLSMKLLGSIFGVPLQMTAGTIAVLALKTIFVPLSLGIALRIAARALADRVAGPVVIFEGTIQRVDVEVFDAGESAKRDEAA